MITIVDYGMGNLRSVQKAVELFHKKVKVSSLYTDVLSADKVILPGVGSFDKAMEELRKRNLVDVIAESIAKGRPFLGICLGFQLLFSESEEGDNVKGLDILKGRVRKFDEKSLKIPHIGWNEIDFDNISFSDGILKDVPDKSYMYFVHSYFVDPEDKGAVICSTNYGRRFASGIKKDNIYAFQFHPEKSQSRGLKILKNFVEI